MTIFKFHKTYLYNHWKNLLLFALNEEPTMTNLYLETINEKFNTFFTSNFIGLILECCVLCLNSQNHKTGVYLKKESHKSNLIEEDYLLKWQLELDSILENTHKDENRTTDYGAMCLALLMADTILTERGVWISSKKGEGVDFWLLNPLTLQPILRLEISGIRKQTTTNPIGIRVKKKMTQTNQSDNTSALAYIIIIEFSEPTALFIQK